MKGFSASVALADFGVPCKAKAKWGKMQRVGEIGKKEEEKRKGSGACKVMLR